MNTDIWLSFLVASTLLCLTPGPAMFLIVGQTVNYGKKAFLPISAGVLSGDAIAITLSLIGMGALLAISASAFTVLKVCGACYLIYMGVKTWRLTVNEQVSDEGEVPGLRLYTDAFMVTALNPKSIMFFMAFFPVFINASTPVLPQMLIMTVTFLSASVLSALLYATFSGYFRARFASYKFRNGFNKTGGAIFVTAGVATLLAQRD